MHAIVIAGGVPKPGEPLYEYTRGDYKALLDVCGKPMAQWVLDALDGTPLVDQVVVSGLEAGHGLQSRKAAAYIPNQGDMLENVRAGVVKVLELDPSARHTLIASSDIPAITPAMVEWVINAAMKTDLDGYYTVIPRSVMEKRYPNSRRSYIHLRGMDICGGDMNIIRTMVATGNDDLWRKIIAGRKNIFKQASLVGYDTLLLLLFRLITLEQAVNLVAKRLHITGQALVSPYAEVGMDVDKPSQLEMMCADMARR